MSAQPFYTLDDLRRWHEIAPTLDPPACVAVIGDPIAHSRSPQMHNPALRARGINAQYIRVQVSPGSVKEALRLFTQNGFIGVNCTIPHKFEALEAMDEVDSLARDLGAVNTVVIEDGQLKGFNSDGPGFLNAVQEAFDRKVMDLHVLILGAGGGAGQAVAIQCALARCKRITVANRTLSKIVTLREKCEAAAGGKWKLSWESIEWTSALEISEALQRVDLVVNASPLGMKAPDPPPFDLSLLRPTHLVFDMVYRSDGDTPLIAAAKAAGAKVCDGLTLLLHQGAISFAHWFGEPVPLSEMRAGLLSAMA